jgi:hypothetical protein
MQRVARSRYFENVMVQSALAAFGTPKNTCDDTRDPFTVA